MRRRERFRKRLNPVLPLVCGLVSTAILFPGDILIGSRFDPGPASVEEAVRRIPYFFGVPFLGWYLWQLLWGESFGPRTMICNQCHQVKAGDGVPNCPCGGQFEPLDNWRWVEDQCPDTKQRTESEERKNA